MLYSSPFSLVFIRPTGHKGEHIMPEPTQAVDPTTNQGTTPTIATPSTTTTPGAQGDGKDKGTSQTGAAAKVVEDLPEWAQRELRDARKEAADRRKALTAAEEAARQAEEATLAQSQQWEKLATKRGGELDALKPKAELADKLTELVLAQYSATIKEWPEQVKAMAPDDGADILSKLTWLEKAKPLAQELLGKTQPTPGNGRGPKPVGATNSKAGQKIDPVYDVKRNF
jgi:hypothetical protein